MSCRILHRYFRLPFGFELHLTHDVMALNKSQRRAAFVYRVLGELAASVAAIILVYGLAVLLSCFVPSAHAAQTTIPPAALQHKAALIRIARSEMGLSAPVALLAAQITIPPHTVYVVVDGGNDENIARALLENKSLGCGWKGTIEVQVQDEESGQWYTVRFDRPEYVPVRARFTVRVLGGVTVDYQTVVRQAVTDYADDLLEGLRGFRVGVAVSPFEMSIAVGTVEPAIFVLNGQVGLLSTPVEDLTAETIPLEIWQKATITQASIDVVAA